VTQQTFDHNLGRDALLHIREDMEVYDANNKMVGTVEDVYLGGSSDEALARGEGPATMRDPDLAGDSLFEDIAEVFAPDDLPEVLRARLLREGFIRIDGAGLFAADRYVTPSQIASVSGDRVMLKATRDQLIKR
jgi:hypothetical protein